MMVRKLLSGVTLVAAATVLMATSASAQNYTYSVISPSTGTVLANFGGGTTALVTSVATTAPALGDGFVGLTPFFNYNRNNDATGGTVDNAQTNLTVQAFRNGVAATNTQTLIYSNDLTSVTVGSGGVTLSDFSANFFSAQFVFNFAAGGGFGSSTLTLGNFGFSNSTGIQGTTGSTDGVVGFNSITVDPPRQTAAPEPGSLALAATGLMGAMGMVIRRRRTAK